MGNTHWTDLILISLMIASAACVAIIGARKQIKFGQFEGLMQEMDNFDKKLLKLSGLFLIMFLILLVIRLIV